TRAAVRVRQPPAHCPPPERGVGHAGFFCEVPHRERRLLQQVLDRHASALPVHGSRSECSGPAAPSQLCCARRTLTLYCDAQRNGRPSLARKPAARTCHVAAAIAMPESYTRPRRGASPTEGHHAAPHTEQYPARHARRAARGVHRQPRRLVPGPRPARRGAAGRRAPLPAPLLEERRRPRPRAAGPRGGRLLVARRPGRRPPARPAPGPAPAVRGGPPARKEGRPMTLFVPPPIPAPPPPPRPGGPLERLVLYARELARRGRDPAADPTTRASIGSALR